MTKQFAPDPRYVGTLTFRDYNGPKDEKPLDVQTCTGRKDAKDHAKHLADGCVVAIVNAAGVTLCTVEEYGA